MSSDSPRTEAVEGDVYGPEEVEILRDMEHIRRRPGMFIGDTGSRGLHHLACALVANSVDEALAGFCRPIHLCLHADGSLSISDDGRGIPVEAHPGHCTTLEVMMTRVGARGRFHQGPYRLSSGLHGLGLQVVNALSEWTEVQVRRNGRVYVQEYARGKPTTAVQDMGPTESTGTRIRFRPDPEIFRGDRQFQFHSLVERLRELAFLNAGLAFRVTDQRVEPPEEEAFRYPDGVADFVRYLNRSRRPVHPHVFHYRAGDDTQRAEVALQWTTSDAGLVLGYANGRYTSLGGTHLEGFRRAAGYSLQVHLHRAGYLPNIHRFPRKGSWQSGLTAIVAVDLQEPMFAGATKERLANPEVVEWFGAGLGPALDGFLRDHRDDARAIADKVLTAPDMDRADPKTGYV